MLPSDFSPEKVARQRFLLREQEMRDAKARRRMGESVESDLREALGKRETFDLGKAPTIKAFVKKAFPSYRKRRVTFRVANSVSLSGGFWDGGSRTEWFGVRSDGRRTPLTYPTAPPQFGGGKVPTFKITDDMWVAQGGTSLGKPASLTFHVSSNWRNTLGLR